MKKSILKTVIFFLSYLLFCISCSQIIRDISKKEAEVIEECVTVFYISRNGDDSWSGTIPEPKADGSDGPYATFDRARNAIRLNRKNATRDLSCVQVLVREGIYPISTTFELSELDSGTDRYPVIYQPYKNEKVHLIGGKEITGFNRVENQTILSRIQKPFRDRIYQISLPSLGINDFGAIHPSGHAGKSPRPIYPTGIELFLGNRPMKLARWPNEGWILIKQVPYGRYEGVFVYNGDRPKRWKEPEHALLHGFWGNEWADAYEKIKHINTQAKQIEIREPFWFYGYLPGKRYYFLNILEEIDEPGEWYLDRQTGILYFWPPIHSGQEKTFISLLENPIIRMRNTSYIELRNFIIEVTRGNGIEIIGGEHNSVIDCTLRNIGNTAVIIQGGIKNKVFDCEIYHIGESALKIRGGDRRTLSPSYHYVENNNIYEYGRWLHTISAAVELYGVGHRIARNQIHHAPQMAIYLNGNEHVIESNEIHNVCLETGDSGAVYIGRDWTMRGNVIRDNYFHDIESPYKGGAKSIYLDDCASGTAIAGNIFFKTKEAIFIAGGRDNIIKDNLFLENVTPIRIDARGLTWMKRSVEKGGTLYSKLQNMPYLQPPWSYRYPALVNILADTPGAPKGNSITCNLFINTGDLKIANKAVQYQTVVNNLTKLNQQVESPFKIVQKLFSDEIIPKSCFNRLPYKKIGLSSYKSFSQD